jgi:hypothetical protein
MPEAPPRRPIKKRRFGLGAIAFGALIVVLIGVGVIALLPKSEEPPKIGDHWHAALGVDICGTFLGNAPEFEERAGTKKRAGLHSHGDGFMHIHPFAADETGDAATVGRFFEYGGGDLTADRIVAWEDTDVSNGGTCPDGRPARVRWAVNGTEQEGNPADYKPEDGDTITVAFLPDGDPIPEPPSTGAVPVRDDVRDSQS